MPVLLGSQAMKKPAAIILVVVILLLGLAAPYYFEDAPRLSAWETDYAAATARARGSGKYVFLYFTGSDWCGWCKRLDKEVFATPEFRKYAEQSFVCVYLDFPQKRRQSDDLRRQNAELAARYRIEGYPSIVILSHSGEYIATRGYQPGGAMKYIETLHATLDQHRKRKSEERPGEFKGTMP
ncbi:MAG: thioredoxin family protein [Verrucomicrobia bacterium]|nr:thioredoxin family protein [Verrucomicrobiota bacterium]